MLEQVVRGPLLVPRNGGHVDYFADGVLAGDARGMIRFAGAWDALRGKLAVDQVLIRKSDGVMLPPLLDIHTHVPQHPIRGHFADGVDAADPAGRLLAGLKRNVFPAEAKCDRDAAHARGVAEQFLADVLAHGVVGGAAYMTPSAAAAEAALEVLPETWSVGMVLMNQNCPEDLRTNEQTLDADVERLAKRFEKRLIVTDRFAVAVDTPLRRRGAGLAERFGLRTQTHLNEQVAEKRLVETTLYPDARSYTDVYRRDGLLDHRCIVAHCIQMRDDEWAVLRDTGSVVAHCPTSNLLLESGVMPLDRVFEHGIPYALGTDVGASPTVSMLAEMARFVTVHEGRSTRATPSEALYRATLAPAGILGIADNVGRLEPGRPMSFIEVQPTAWPMDDGSADDAACGLLPVDFDAPAPSVNRVTLAGRVVYVRTAGKAAAHA
jgi:guanine deaminase